MSHVAGWYDDPDDSSQLRYWDGVQWTAHRSPKVKPGLDRAGQAARQAGHGTVFGQQGGGGPAEQGGQSTTQGNPYGRPEINPYAGQTGQQPYQPMPGGQLWEGAGGDATPDGAPLAAWGMRLLARLIDGIVLSLLLAPLVLLLAPDLVDGYRELLNHPEDYQDPAQMQAFLNGFMPQVMRLTAVNAVVGMLYEMITVAALGGQVGKLATGLRVRPYDQAGRPSWGSAFVRAAVWVLPALVASGIFQIIDGLWPLWDDKRQALHDKAAKTVVVRRAR